MVFILHLKSIGCPMGDQKPWEENMKSLRNTALGLALGVPVLQARLRPI